ncbi:LOW QUALITY PROTEIN: protein mono-ADP-ribosyltransferase PARP14 [Microcaecilia unicolor]|uniref:Poly [ADP-ribose] polymerase n=1 Tax=Microcaecilia unicolor TaxID=1415580 RepID=A0A6P7YPS9_9AMPH|nr:LOW QUALITY PROTEIN: protein mono-ADP-ribosyltransferase PARP14 [Microcaecilia unicolor]
MGDGNYPYPLLVRGDWGDPIPKGLKNKLLCYFQSPKKSGGGDCVIAELTAQHALICFGAEEVRNKVLNKSIHKLPLSDKGTLELEVKLPDEPKDDVVPENVSSATFDHHTPARSEDVSLTESCPRQETHTVLVTVSGGEIGNEFLELYFENKMHSGGGPITSLHQDGQGIKITFENAKDAQEVLRRESHTLKNSTLHVRSLLEECVNQPQTTPSLSVLLENVQENFSQEMLTMLVENISNLEEDCFQTELIPEVNVAAVTFMTQNEAEKFLAKCPLSSRIKQLKITARPLEVTKCIRVENLPEGVHKEYLIFYFESQKCGGGSVLDVTILPDENAAVVTFLDPEVRNKVLNKSIHKLPLSDKGTLELEVKLPDEPKDDVVSSATFDHHTPARSEDVSLTESCPRQETHTVLVTVSGGEIGNEFLELYFENKMHSGGGPITSLHQDGQGIKITFENAKDAQEVLKRESHTLKNSTLHVRSLLEECVNQPQTTPSLSVLLENVQENFSQEMLTMLVENISNLEEDCFQTELIPEVNVAAVTFMTQNEAEKFLAKCPLSSRIKQLKITARPLEVTKCIRVENLPEGVHKEYLIFYFESQKCGGGSVLDVTILPDENAAVVTFLDPEAVSAVLSTEHFLKKIRVSVYPFYSSLGTALYGKERPVVNVPDPLSLDIDPYVWQYIQKNRLIQEINKKMADWNCELKWPEPNCAHAVIQLCPSRSLSKQRSHMAKLVRTWPDQVGTQFLSIMSKYSSIEYKVNSAVWGAVKEKVKNAISVGILIVLEIDNGKVVFAGFVEDIERSKQKVTELIENATKEIDRESQSSKMLMSLGRATYAILHNEDLEENLHAFFPDLKISYDAPSRKICLYGLPAEVFGAKCEILEKKQNFVQKTIDLNSHIVQFLRQVDNEEFSCSLFINNTIYVVYKILGESVVLTGNSHDVFFTAEKKLKESVICKFIDIEGSTATQKEEWKDLTSQLMKTFNSATKTVIIEYASKSLKQVVVVGCCEAVNKVYQQASDFIEKNTVIEKTIPTKSQAVVLFMKDEKAHLWTATTKDVKTVFDTRNGRKHITLCGPRVDVLDIARRVQMILASLHTDTLVIDKPGAKKFFLSAEDIYIPAARKKFNCLLRLQRDGEEFGNDADEDEEAMNHGQPCCKAQLPGGVEVAVYKGDLGKHQVDVVVNASNEDLKHIGGLAAALLQAAGPELQKDCDQIVQSQGKLKPGDAVITEAGNLACKQVIHAVGPRWSDFPPAQCEILLSKVVEKSLQLAELYNLRSIAIPAISSGVFGFPLNRCVETILTSIKEYMGGYKGEGVLQQIHLVDNSEKTIQAFKTALQMVFKQEVQQNIVLNKPQPKPRSIRGGRDRAESRKCLQQMKTKEGLSVMLVQGSIQDAETDVIVNSISTDLMLDKGAVSQALLEKAGPALQQLLEDHCRGLKITEGSLFVTNGCNLNCKKVYHVTSPGWGRGKGTSEKVLSDIIKDCLNTAEKSGLSSITFPAIGTGNLGFPRPLVASIVFDRIFKFSSKMDLRNLQEVHILLHSADTESIKAFSSELEKRGTGKTPAQSRPSGTTASAQGPPFCGAISQPTLGVYEMQIGAITFQVKTGDITKETVDVIVNSSNDKFNLKSGVSKAILDGAGQSVELECTQLAQQPNSGHIVTQNGNLQCQKIIHVIGRTASADIEICMRTALEECEQLTCSSVAFPAIGTGQGNADPSSVADAMIEGVVDFATQNTPQFVKTIKIIIFQPQMVNTFYASMKQREGTHLPAPQTVLGKFLSFFTGQKPKPEKKKRTAFISKNNFEPAIFQICGESYKAVENTASWIKDLILKEQQESVIKDEWIAEFEEEEHSKLDELQKKLQITIQVDCESSEPLIRVSGLTRDVLQACNEIQDMIKKGKDENYKKREAEIISNLVEWQYLVTGSGWVPFDSLSNLALERGYSEQDQTTTINLRKVKYKVDFVNECAKDEKGKQITIKRISKTEGAESMEAPKHWDPMKITDVKEVPLPVGCPEYNKVAALFQKSCKLQILKIERIQNLTLWKSYQIKKMNMDAKNGHKNNERQLFHGTAPHTLKAINDLGFNRSYAGLNAAAYGNGTYFAVQAQYSAANQYSKPDASGQKYMYLAQVLAGDYCVGRAGIVTPQSKSTSDPTNLYDSVTDNTTAPSMFVIFSDNHAYPEYLITFK